MKKEWNHIALGDVLTRADRFEERDEWTEYPFAGTYSFARGIFVGERKMGSSFKLPKIQRIKEGDFVYCKIMAWEGAFGLVPPSANDCVMSGAFVAYEVDTARLDSRFLDLYFKIPSNWKGLGGQSSGTNIRRQSLHPRQFEAHEIPLPPLAEQRRIVAWIEALAGEIEEARRLRREASDETEAIMGRHVSCLFESRSQGKLPPAGTRLGFSKSTPEKPDFEAPFDNAVKSARWEWKQIGQISELINGDRGPNYPNKAEYVSEGVPWINTGHIRPGGSLSISSMHFITREKFDTLRSGKIRCGDLVYCLRGATIGKTAVITQFNEGAVASSLVIIRLGTEIDPWFAYRFLVSPLGQQQIIRFDNGSAQPNLSADSVKRFWVPVPPLPEQRRIVAELDALQAEVDTLKRLQSETAAELDALLPTILDRAFKGELS